MTESKDDNDGDESHDPMDTTVEEAAVTVNPARTVVGTTA